MPYSAARTQVKNNEVHASLSARLPRHVRDYPPTPAGRKAANQQARPRKRRFIQRDALANISTMLVFPHNIAFPTKRKRPPYK
jgi:hypothetical protein